MLIYGAIGGLLLALAGMIIPDDVIPTMDPDRLERSVRQINEGIRDITEEQMEIERRKREILENQ